MARKTIIINVWSDAAVQYPKTCANCRFYRPADGGGEVGDCLRFPPFQIQPRLRSFQVRTRRLDTCGEFVAADELREATLYQEIDE